MKPRETAVSGRNDATAAESDECRIAQQRCVQGSGELTLLKTVLPEITVGATCLDSKRNILYCAHEYATLPGYFLGGGGQVYALAIDPATGDLTEINHQPSYGALASYVAIDATGKYLIATNHTAPTPVTKVVKDASGSYRISLEYDDAATVLFRLNEDCSICTASAA